MPCTWKLYSLRLVWTSLLVLASIVLHTYALCMRSSTGVTEGVREVGCGHVPAKSVGSSPSAMRTK